MLNENYRKTINILVLWFLDVDGRGVELTGGMERWCRDLARLLVANGFHVNIYQKANIDFRIKYAEHIQVTGIRSGLRNYGNFTFARRIKNFIQPDNPVIVVSQELAMFAKFNNAIDVNHGIWWHSDMNKIKLIFNKFIQKHTLLNFKATICVDTNYINWCHAELSEREKWAHKLLYVPNYSVETVPAENVDGGKKIILFPRRMMGKSLEKDPRGSFLFLQAAKKLIVEKKHFGLEFWMVGRNELSHLIEEWAKENGIHDKLRLLEASFDEMPFIYQKAAVVVVPTFANEGTSLAAIEGMISGKSVVVTHIGGLANIVINGVNGYVADLSVDSLVDRIEEALRINPMSRREVHESVVKSLGKKRWDEKIMDCVSKFITA